MSLVKMDGITKIYNTNGIEFPALGGVSFDVEAGEFL
ncbi:MAG: macrolide ABC transporter ATP-binding protein, partial [bacterium]|nr:macrolide ABC transporter ATP-binding protein [bacterium]